LLCASRSPRSSSSCCSCAATRRVKGVAKLLDALERDPPAKLSPFFTASTKVDTACGERGRVKGG
jgi:hypothetical protein